ncbi:hypothetical protein LPJ59_005362 [Coemansia sp. RSA 2399]|nr:hypothetical protein LPJ59_005362 [Coemansia sp. RSA 2399]
MKKDIAQVEGCAFSTEELQQFHQYYKHPWEETTKVNERIEYFVRHIDPTADGKRLRMWLRTMGVVDSSEKSSEAQVYERFEGYDFAHAPGFNETLGAVYMGTDGADGHAIGARMEQAKAEYYARHVEPMDYAAYQAHKEESAPAPVCPYQHLWEDARAKGHTVDGRGFDRVKVIDLVDFVRPGAVLTAAVMDSMCAAVVEAHSPAYYAAALVSSAATADDEAEPEFLPRLAHTHVPQTMRAYVRLQVALRRLNQAKPLVVFASGRVDASTLGIILATADVITTERFSVDMGPTTASAHTFPLAGLHDWAHLAQPCGTAEYVLCNTKLVLHSSEWAALGLGSGVVAHRHLAAAMDRILLAASCPPPHTRDALRKAYVVESAYPGPSRIGVWAAEIARHFAPLASATTSVDDVAVELAAVQAPWAAQFAFDSVAALRVAALRKARAMPYSAALALELGATVAWASGERSVEALLAAAADPASVAEIAGGSADASERSVEAIPAECPFAQMYRENPDRFKNVDLSAVAGHKALNL